MARNIKERYCLYFPDEGKYTTAMSLREAKLLVKQFMQAYVVNIETAEIYG